MEDERRKAKVLELSKKKEELDKKSRKAEIKKKKCEDDMKKMLDEEVEKRNAQRKALEESFWARVKAKGKDKPVDKINLNFDTPVKKEDDNHADVERMPSVESAKSYNDLSEKQSFMSTQSVSLKHGLQGPRKDPRSNTFTNFSKDLTSPTNAADSDFTKMGRQRSVDDLRNRRKEGVNLPYIENNKKKSRDSFEVL